MARTKLTGYTDAVSVTEGETVQFMLSAEGVAEAQVDLVRLIHGDEHPEGPGFIEEVVPSDALGDPSRSAGSSSTSARASTSTTRRACSTCRAR